MLFSKTSVGKSPFPAEPPRFFYRHSFIKISLAISFPEVGAFPTPPLFFLSELFQFFPPSPLLGIILGPPLCHFKLVRGDDSWFRSMHSQLLFLVPFPVDFEATDF